MPQPLCITLVVLNKCVLKIHTPVHDCVWYQPSSKALDFHKIMWLRIRVGVRSKVMHGGVIRALVLATVCDLLGVGFLGDLINRYRLYRPTDKQAPAGGEINTDRKSLRPRAETEALLLNFLSLCPSGVQTTGI